MGLCQSTQESPEPRRGGTGGGSGSGGSSSAAASNTGPRRYPPGGEAGGADIVRLGSGNRRLIPFDMIVWEAPAPMQASELQRRRDEFWETRTEGRRETWEVLKLVVSCRDLSTAQAIIDDAGLRLPTGNLVDGAFDPSGIVYRLPPFVVSEPLNLVLPEDPAALLRASEATAAPRDSVELRNAAAISEAAAAGNPPNLILRYSSGIDKKVFLPTNASGRLARSVAIANQDSPKGGRVLVFYLGRPITDAVQIKDLIRTFGDAAATDLPVLQVMVPSA